MDFSQKVKYRLNFSFTKYKKREYLSPILCKIMEITPALKRYLKPLSGSIAKFTEDSDIKILIQFSQKKILDYEKSISNFSNTRNVQI